jgi:hypothetical protein
MRGPSVRHAEELRALPREHDRRRHRRSLSADPMKLT